MRQSINIVPKIFKATMSSFPKSTNNKVPILIIGLTANHPSGSTHPLFQLGELDPKKMGPMLKEGFAKVEKSGMPCSPDF